LKKIKFYSSPIFFIVSVMLFMISVSAMLYAQTEISLSLSQAFKIAIEKNLTAKIYKNSFQQSHLDLKKQKLKYGIEPKIEVSYNKSGSLSSYDKVSTTVSAGKKFPTGTDISIGLGSDFYLHNSTSQTGLTVNINQPLLKGAGKVYNKHSERLAKISLENKKIDFYNKINEILKDTEIAYWNSYYDIQNLKLKKHALKLAKDLLRMNKLRVKLGLLAKLDLIESESTVAIRKEDLIKAKNSVDNSKEILLNIINFRSLGNNHNIRISSAPLVQKTEFNTVQLIQKALKNNFQYALAKSDLKINLLNLKYYKNLTKPELNAGMGFGINGSDSSYAKSYSEMFKGEDYSVEFTLSLKFPVSVKQDEYELEKQKLDKKRFLLTLQKVRKDVVFNVKSTTRNIRAAFQRIEASKKAKSLAQKKHNLVVRKFNLKLSSSNDVLLAQKEFLEAGLNLEKAILDYHRYRAMLYYYCGTSSKKFGIKINLK